MYNTVIILDTETISLGKPFIYDLGFIVARAENGVYKPIYRSQAIITQIYDNAELFATAYYAEKKPRYTRLLKGRKTRKKKFGWAIHHLKKTIEKYDVEAVFAYNASFDKKALNFTAKHFKYNFNFNGLKWLDIMAIANNFIHTSKEYIDFANENKLFGPSGRYYQTNAEATYKFITNNKNYIEPHMALQDCEIELDILNYAIENGYSNKDIVKKRFLRVE